MAEIIIQFTKDLSKKLESDNQILKKSISNSQEAIQGNRLQKQQLFSSMCNELNVENHPKLYLVNYLVYSNQLGKTSLQNGLQQITQGVTQHNAVYSEWKKQMQQNLEFKQDAFTMMPFHGVEQEMNGLDVKIKKIMEETANSMKETQSKNMLSETQRARILEDVTTIEPYQKEMREHIIHHINIISEMRRKRKLDDFQLRLDEQLSVKLQNEINELRAELLVWEKNSAN